MTSNALVLVVAVCKRTFVVSKGWPTRTWAIPPAVPARRSFITLVLSCFGGSLRSSIICGVRFSSDMVSWIVVLLCHVVCPDNEKKKM